MVQLCAVYLIGTKRQTEWLDKILVFTMFLLHLQSLSVKSFKAYSIVLLIMLNCMISCSLEELLQNNHWTTVINLCWLLVTQPYAYYTLM